MTASTPPDGRDESIHLEAVASDEATINQAGRDLHIHHGVGPRRVVPGGGRPDLGCPYPGLTSFTAEEGKWFYGRDQLTADLLVRLNGCLAGGGPVMVVAASGAGKSSVLRAGLLLKVAEGALTPTGSRRWPRVVFTPGARPMHAAAAALLTACPADVEMPADPSAEDLDSILARAAAAAGPGARAVMVVDQFEELFRLCEQEDKRGAFISWLWQATSGDSPNGPAALAVCAVRADSYPDCARYPQIQQALQRNQVIVGAMSPDELRQAITCPAEAVGLEIEPGLTELLLADLRVGSPTAGNGSLAADDGAGRLPLLAYALQATWQQRHGSTLTVQGYRQAGGIEHAIAEGAERVFARLSAAARQETRALFLRLVKIGDTSGEDIRRPVARHSLASDSSVAGAAIDAFTNSRLLTQSRDTIQITHEALLRAWPRLAAWLDEDRAGQLLRQRIEDDAADWDRGRRDPSLLYRGARMQAAALWADSHKADLGSLAESFLAVSRRRARRSLAVLRATIAILVTLVLVAGITSVVALQQRAGAQAARSEALQQRDQAIENEIMAEASQLENANPSLAAELNLVAYHRQPTPSVVARLLSTESVPLSAPVASAAFVNSAVFSTNGRVLAFGSNTSVQLWNVTNTSRPTRLGRPFSSQSDTVLTVAFSPSGDILASGSIDGTIQLWNVTNPNHVTAINPALKVPGQDPNVLSVAFSRDGKTLASASQGGTVQLWDITDPARVTPIGQPLTTGDGLGGTVMFSPDSRTLAFELLDGSNGIVRLWDVADPGRAAPIGQPIHVSRLSAVAFSPVGSVLATGSEAGTVQLWNVTNLARAVPIGQPLLGHTNSVNSLAFSPDGRTLASGSSDDSIRLWDVTNPAEADLIGQPLLGHTNSVNSLAFSPDGRTLASSSNDGTVRLWDLPSPVELQQPGGAEAIAFSPTSHLLAGVGGSYLELWNVANPDRPSWIGGLEDVTAQTVAFSPNGRILASGTDEGTIRIWTVSSLGRASLASQFRIHPTAISDIRTLAFSPDGHIMSSGSTDGTIRLWDVSDPTRPVELGRPLSGWATGAVAFSPSGRILASAEGKVVLWDITDPAHPKAVGQPLTPNSGAASALAFSPNGRTLADGNTDGTISLWEITNPTHPVLVKEALSGHTNSVDSVAFSPDGHTLASGSLDDTVRLWDVTDPAQPEPIGQPLTGHANFVTSVAYSPNGQILDSGSLDGTIRLWSLSSALRRICAATGNTLTSQAWALYIPQLPYDPPCRG